MNKRGTVSILVAATVPIALVAGIFVTDLAREWVRKARFQTALDAAALQAARDMDSPDRDKNTRAVMAANHNGILPENVSITPSTDGNRVTVAGSVTVDKIMAGVTGLSGWIAGSGPLPGIKSTKITRSADAVRTTRGTELALVFDITLSMVQSDAGSIEDGSCNGTNGRNTRIRAACDAALLLLETLYGDLPPLQNGAPNPANKTWLPNLFVSVVPFNVAVNYGAANTHFLAAAPPSSAYPASWAGPTSWGGCVEMRSVSLGDANTRDAANGLRRFYWPSTYDAAKKYDATKSNTASAQPHCLSNAAYADTRSGSPSGAHRVCMGHNDWTAPAYLLSGSNGSGGKQNTLVSTFAGDTLVKAAGVNAWATAHGPNMMCPPDTGDRRINLTVLPLTRDRGTIEARINALVGQSPHPMLPFSYGTNIVAGLQAGWFTLSPNWRAENGFAGWPSAEPPADPNEEPQRPVLPRLPLNYFAENMDKVMIVLTDGDQNWANARELQGNGNTLVRPESREVAGFYSAYGKLGPDYSGDDREAVNVPANPSNVSSATTTAMSSAEGRMDSEAEAWCQKIRTRKPKANPSDPDGPEQVTIYTIGFGSGVGSRATKVLTNCASLKDGVRQYFHAPDADRLKAIFKAIANDLARLRLSR